MVKKSESKSEGNGKKVKTPVLEPVVVKQERVVEYPILKATLQIGDKAITAKAAKKHLGWDETTEPTKDTFITFGSGKKARYVSLQYNNLNRPFDEQHARKLAQDMITRRWADSRNGKTEDGEDMTINGEAIVVGKYGNILSGQHRLFAVIFAQEMLDGPQGVFWKELWPDGEVSFESVVVVGVDESGVTTRTLDNTKPRQLEDTLYSDPTFFKGEDKETRQVMTKMTRRAVQLMWLRTKVKDDAFNPYATNSEMGDFLKRHETLLKIVKDVANENKKTATSDGSHVNQYIEPGFMSAIVYLAGSSESEPDYLEKNAGLRTEQDGVNWKALPIAQKFLKALVMAAQVKHQKEPEAKTVLPLKNIVRPGTSDYIFFKGEGSGSVAERLAFLAEGWEAFKTKGKVDTKDLQLEYKEEEEGNKHLIQSTSFGGIDKGDIRGEDKAQSKKDAKNEEEKAQLEELGVEALEEEDEEILEFVRGEEDETPEQERLRRAALEETRKRKDKEAKQKQIEESNDYEEDEEPKLDPVKFNVKGNKPRKGKLAVKKHSFKDEGEEVGVNKVGKKKVKVKKDEYR